MGILRLQAGPSSRKKGCRRNRASLLQPLRHRDRVNIPLVALIKRREVVGSIGVAFGRASADVAITVQKTVVDTLAFAMEASLSARSRVLLPHNLRNRADRILRATARQVAEVKRVQSESIGRFHLLALNPPFSKEVQAIFQKRRRH